MTPSAPEILDDIDDVAAGWFARQRAGDLAPPEAERLEAWLDADPAHRAALDALYRAWQRAELARHDPEIMAWRERAKGRTAWPGRLALAACLAVALIGGAAFWSSGLIPGHGRFYDQTFNTDLGQRATFTLPDGSTVTLNTDTRLRTRAEQGRRMVYLDKGQAFFRVAKDPSRPFVVHAAGRTVTALGTAFDVRVDRKRFEVTLVEGKVRVEAPAPPSSARTAAAAPVTQATEMAAGSQLVVADATNWSLKPADTARATSWLAGRLMFEDEPLGAVAAEFARYSERRIVFTQASLAKVPVTGTFRSGDVDTFVRALERYRLARVEARSDTEVRLAPY